MQAERTPYAGETYYGLPAVKSSHYRWLIVTYFFIGGLASAAQFIATVVDWFGDRQDRTLVRAGRYIALAGALVSPPLLIADLNAPQRWYNMLRIYRRTSAMSVGSWSLSVFGACSGLVAVGQALDDLFGWALGRRVARLFSLPAALAGGVVSLYTGTLLAATNLPLWSGAYPLLSSLFATSAVSTATASLALIADASHAPATTRRRLNRFALLTGLTELTFALLVDRNWRRRQVAAPLRQGPFDVAWQSGVLGLGIGAPLAAHAAQAIARREWRPVTILAALAALAGGFILRVVLVFGGRDSGSRPQDYFRIAQDARN